MKTLFVTLLTLWVFLTQAQSSVNTNGVSVKNQFGSISYSIGQVVYQNKKTVNGYIEQGVQNPYSNLNVFSKDIYIPNAFKPNGVNKIFRPEGLYINYEQSSMQIFNRWGEMIVSKTNITEGWNGVDDRGIYCQSGVYVYKFEIVSSYKSKKIKTGYVTLLE